VAAIYKYRCNHCGYEAEVCGKPAMTFMAYLETISCLDCKELYDVAFARQVDDDEGGGRIGGLLNDCRDPVIDSLKWQLEQEREDAEADRRPMDSHLVEEINAVILTRTAMGGKDGFQRVAPRAGLGAVGMTGAG